MSNKMKDRARALAKKLNIRYQAALTKLEASNAQSIQGLLERLRADTPFPILVGRLRAVGVSASEQVANEQAAKLASNPVIFARGGSVSMEITPQQSHALIHCGAADANTTQMIRSFRDESFMTFSERCDTCGRWIGCGSDERAGTCFCGHAYRVAFDLAPPYQWTRPHNARCMDCGVERIMHAVERGVTPWHLVNEGQSRCNICHVEAGTETATEGDQRAAEVAVLRDRFLGMED